LNQYTVLVISSPRTTAIALSFGIAVGIGIELIDPAMAASFSIRIPTPTPTLTPTQTPRATPRLKSTAVRQSLGTSSRRCFDAEAPVP
jgi:hypothetical protein